MNSQDVYRLQFVNLSESFDLNLTLEAYNLSTGASAWTSVPVFVRAATGQFWSGNNRMGVLFADEDTVSLVVVGTGEWTTGQSAAISLPSCAIFVLEWNASTGAFLGAQRTGSLGNCFPYVGAIQGDGWIVLDWGPPTNVTWNSTTWNATTWHVSLATFPEASPSPQYGTWNRNLSVGPVVCGTASGYCWPEFWLTIGRGLVTITEVNGNHTLAVLEGSRGSLAWQGQLPAGPNPLGTGNALGMIGYGVRAGVDLDYIGVNGSERYLMSFNLDTFVASVVDTLSFLGWSFPSLQVTQNGELLVTDSSSRTIYVYSSTGELLWSRQMAFVVTGESPNTNVTGWLSPPLELGGGYLLVNVGWISSGESGPPNATFYAIFTMSLLLLNGTSGAVAWQFSYSASMSGQIGSANETMPVLYTPVLAQGQYVAYWFGQNLSIAQFTEVPSR